jgi:hypothetical protein
VRDEIQMKNKTNKRGQMTILSLLTFFMLMAVFVILLKPLQAFIEIGINATENMSEGATIALILNSTPVLMALAVVISLFISISVYRAQ